MPQRQRPDRHRSRRSTGEIRMKQIFVAVPGAPSFTFAKATWTQALPDWIQRLCPAFEAIGSVPELVVPDNAKTAIVEGQLLRPSRSTAPTPGVAAHYGTAILPARPRKARDKAEGRAGRPDRRALARGQLGSSRVFHSLADVDAALGELMTQLNERQGLGRLGVTRRQILEEVDPPPPGAQGAHPASLENTAGGACARCSVDYHVDIDTLAVHVPYRFARAEVEARLTRACGSRFSAEWLSASPSSPPAGTGRRERSRACTVQSTRRYAGWAVEAYPRRRPRDRPGDLRHGASKCWKRPHPEQGYTACSASRASRRLFGCRAHQGDCRARHRDRRRTPVARSNPSSMPGSIGGPRKSTPADTAPILHPNIRGPRYYARDQRAQTSNLDRLDTLGLNGMAQAFADLAAADQAKDWPTPTGSPCSAAWRPRGGGTNASRPGCAPPNCVSRRASKMSIIAPHQGLDRALFQKLSEDDWIDAHDNLALVFGRPASARGGLACASVGQKACRTATIGQSSVIATSAKLYEDHSARRKAASRHPRLIASIARADLLVLGDFGLKTPQRQLRRDLLENSRGAIQAAGRRWSPPSSPVHRREVGGDPAGASLSWTASSIMASHRIGVTGEPLRRTRGQAIPKRRAPADPAREKALSAPSESSPGRDHLGAGAASSGFPGSNHPVTGRATGPGCGPRTSPSLGSEQKR